MSLMSPSVPGTVKPSILIVEDDTYLIEALRDLILNAGYGVVVASRFSDALVKTNNQRFHCILMDLQLEVGSGAKVVTQLRNESARQAPNFATPIILMSGNLEAEIVKALAGKVQAVLAKPFDAKVILAKIQELVARKV